MKYLTILFYSLAILSYNNVNAQKVSYWVRISEHHDPIIRFMDAFNKYINNHSMETVAVVSTETTQIVVINL